MREVADGSERTPRLVLCLAWALIASLAACASDDPTLVVGVVETVTAIDNTFRPGEIEVAAGTTVVWENRGRNDHNILQVDGKAWGVSTDKFAPGDSYQHRFTEPGTFAYYCSLHGTTTKGMVGTIVVTG